MKDFFKIAKMNDLLYTSCQLLHKFLHMDDASFTIKNINKYKTLIQILPITYEKIAIRK